MLWKRQPSAEQRLIAFLEGEVERLRQENVRLHTLLEQQGQSIQALTQRPDGQLHVVHAYASELLPALLIILASFGSLVWNFLRGVDWGSRTDLLSVIFGLVGIITGSVTAYLVEKTYQRQGKARVEAQQRIRQLQLLVGVIGLFAVVITVVLNRVG